MRERLTWLQRVVTTPTSWRRVVGALLAALFSDLALEEPSWPTSLENRSAARGELMPERRPRPAGPEVFDRVAESELDRAVRRQPFCVATENWSAGMMGDVVLYRAERTGDDVRVGYFVYWSTERPWGNNQLTHTVLPALAIDAVYSHFLFVFPGLQRALYGAGDIEGALVEYTHDASGLAPRRALADDATHQPVRLPKPEIVAEDGSVILMTEAWSHQLGARDAARRSLASANVRCFEGKALQPMTVPIARAFRLGDAARPRRARPAWSGSID